MMSPWSQRTVPFLAVLLFACSEDTTEEPDGEGWCVEGECARPQDASRDTGSDASGDLEEVGQDAELDVGSDADAWMSQPIDGDFEPPRPEWVGKPLDLGQTRLLTVHEETVCVASGEHGVQCWGDNAYGRAQPPEGLWADEIVLTETYGCAVTPPTNFTCWGDGFEDVRAIQGNQMLGRHTLYGASGSAELLCYSSDYVEDSATIECADEDEIWEVGPSGVVGLDVQYEDGDSPDTTVCYAWKVGVRYQFECVHDGKTIVVATTTLPVTHTKPHIRHDGGGQVAVMDETGEVTWYDLGLDELDVVSPEDGIYRATRIPVDWGPHRDEYEQSREGARLVSPNCVFYGGFALVCRDTAGEKMDYLARQNATLVAAHEQEDGRVNYCFVRNAPGELEDGELDCGDATR